MRFTHPVNTLKKLGCGLAFGAAAIMAMPASALACTQIYMGSKLTADGNTYYGRSEDFGPRYIKHFGIEPAHKDGNEYTSVESGFEYKSKGATYRYTFVRDNPSQWEDRYDAYSEAGINEKGVSCSATLSTSYNEKAEEADPITEETGIGGTAMPASSWARVPRPARASSSSAAWSTSKASAPMIRSSSPTAPRLGCSPRFPAISGLP